VSDTAKGYITPGGMKRMVDEYEDLRHNQRPKIVEEVSRAAALGDRSENAEYIYGKRKLREIDRRLGYLAKRMESVQVVDPKTMRGSSVGFGATVKVEYEDGKVVTYSIIGEDEVDAGRGRISYKSPVGRALLNRRVGDTVTVQRPAGPVEVTVLELEYRAID
jgi:transcription elongation factor GreB